MIDWTQVKTAEGKQAKATEQAYLTAKSNRQAAYVAEADPLFFKSQRGEVPEQEWLDKVAEIEARYPYEVAL